jgi:hypothetical protein
MRTFTEIAEDRLLVALSGEQAAAIAGALEATVRANETMRSYYEQKKTALAGGE